MKSESTRRQITSARLYPAMVRTCVLAFVHDQIVALDQQEAEIAREVGLLEIGLAVGAGRHRQMRGCERVAASASEARSARKKGATRSTFMLR